MLGDPIFDLGYACFSTFTSGIHCRKHVLDGLIGISGVFRLVCADILPTYNGPVDQSVEDPLGRAVLIFLPYIVNSIRDSNNNILSLLVLNRIDDIY